MSFKICLALFLCLSLCSCSPARGVEASSSSSEPVSEDAAGTPLSPDDYPLQVDDEDIIFTHEPLPAEIIEKIIGVSWVENENIGLEDLSLLTLGYRGFDGKSYLGQMVCANEAAEDLCDIFKELYENDFPIEKIRLIDDYDADDNRSMADNNSSAFCYRVIDGTEYLSNHSYGLAVDINPLQNPYVRGDLVQPEAATEYLDRENVRPGMITQGDLCYNAFISRGWSWGGDWTGPIDYQHFEKTVS